MKTTLLTLTGILLSLPLSAQHLKGIVREKSGAPVANAQIIIKDVTFSKTISSGGFELKLPANHVAGTRIVLDVQKEGMELVDEREIVTYVRRDPNDLVVVRMAPQGEKQRETARIKENLRQSIERSYKKKYEEQQQQYSLQQDLLADENSRLGRERDQALQLVDELAKEMYRADLSSVDSTYRLAYNLFIDGKVEEAEEVLEDLNGRKKLDDIKIEEHQAQIRAEEREKTKKQLAQAQALKAKVKISKLKFKEAEEAYELAVEADTTNFEITFEFALFLQEQNQFAKVESQYRRALTLAKDAESKATILNNLGMFYNANQKMSEAEKAFNEALNIQIELSKKSPNALLSGVIIILNSIAPIQSELEKDNYKMLNNRMVLAKNPDAFLSDLPPFMAFWELAIKQKLYEAQRLYDNSKQRADKDSDSLLPKMASTLNNLGNHYSANNIMSEAEKAYNEALSIRRQLAAKDPDAFLSDLSNTLNSLGVFYSDIQKMSEAEKAYNEALSIRRQLAAKDPDAFLPYVANTMNNMGNYYSDIQKTSEAEQAYDEALSIRRQLAAKNPDAFLPYVANTLNNMGNYYSNNNRIPDAEKVYCEALNHFRKLATKNPKAFVPYVATALYNLGLFFKNIKNYSQALDCFEECLKIRQEEILNGQMHFYKNWIEVWGTIHQMQDTLTNRKHYGLACRAYSSVATTFDSLSNKKFALIEYRGLSWWALFARDYPLAERAALRCLALDPEQIYVYTNLGHSHLLRGDIAKAKAAYLPLKGKKDDGGKDYKLVLEEDFQALEAEGITYESMAEIRKWLREEW